MGKKFLLLSCFVVANTGMWGSEERDQLEDHVDSASYVLVNVSDSYRMEDILDGKLRKDLGAGDVFAKKSTSSATGKGRTLYVDSTIYEGEWKDSSKKSGNTKVEGEVWQGSFDPGAKKFKYTFPNYEMDFDIRSAESSSKKNKCCGSCCCIIL
jgi:hypothetical protein